MKPHPIDEQFLKFPVLRFSAKGKRGCLTMLVLSVLRHKKLKQRTVLLFVEGQKTSIAMPPKDALVFAEGLALHARMLIDLNAEAE